MKLFIYLLSLLALNLSAHAAVEIGNVAPDLEFTLTGDKTASLSDYEGKWVVLYFYPKSDTPGCTKQACSLRDDYSALQDLNAVVLGASVDTLEAQENFKEKFELPFNLIADDQKKLAQKFNVLRDDRPMAQRKTFIINPHGNIAYIFDVVKTATHYQEVAEVLEELQSQ